VVGTPQLFNTTLHFKLTVPPASGVTTFPTLPNLRKSVSPAMLYVNPLKAELNPVCHLLTLLGAHHILHISRIRFKVKYPRYRPGCGPEGGRGIALLFQDLGARRG